MKFPSLWRRWAERGPGYPIRRAGRLKKGRRRLELESLERRELLNGDAPSILLAQVKLADGSLVPLDGATIKTDTQPIIHPIVVFSEDMNAADASNVNN